MSERRPTLTIVIGTDGAGKSTWAAQHRGRLPSDFYDTEQVAHGLGSWENQRKRNEARRIIDDAIEAQLRKGKSFGLETTYADQAGPELVRRAWSLDYDVDAVFVGTGTPAVHVRRTAYRSATGRGPRGNADDIHRQWTACRDNLVKTARWMTRIEVVDNSGRATGEPPPRQTGEGEPTDPAPAWVRELTERIRRRTSGADAENAEPGPETGMTAGRPKSEHHR